MIYYVFESVHKKQIHDHNGALNMYGMFFAGHWLQLQTTISAISKSKY